MKPRDVSWAARALNGRPPAREPAPWSEIALPNLIEERVALARLGDNPFVISRLKSSWLVIGDVQPLPGYCLLRMRQYFAAR